MKVSPTKGAVRFGSTCMLKPIYIGPFYINVRVIDLAYELALVPNIDGVPNVFHVSMLIKYVRDESHIIPNFTELDIQPNAT